MKKISTLVVFFLLSLYGIYAQRDSSIFRAQHKEKMSYELFLGNVPDTHYIDSVMVRTGSAAVLPAYEFHQWWILNFSKRYLSRRLGMRAYDNQGNLMPGFKPLFISRDEYLDLKHSDSLHLQKLNKMFPKNQIRST